jgi:hypothetical protein
VSQTGGCNFASVACFRSPCFSLDRRLVMRVGLDAEGRACVTVHEASWKESRSGGLYEGIPRWAGRGMDGFREAVWFWV